MKEATVTSADVKAYWLLLVGRLLFEVAGVTCEVSDLKPGETRLNLTTGKLAS